LTRGWLAPSLQHRVDTTKNLVNRLRSLVPVEFISQELVRFDTQKMENPEVSGVEYQQGTLLGYEVREYLLEKWGRECAYCTDKDTPLQIEHIDPKANGGSNRIRYGTRRGASRHESWHLAGSCGGSENRQLQYSDKQRCHSGNIPSPLCLNPASGWLRLSHPTQPTKGGGRQEKRVALTHDAHSLPDLKGRVSRAK
jgi:5-methylcytosine-specific restriction endonuclease McrA